MISGGEGARRETQLIRLGFDRQPDVADDAAVASRGRLPEARATTLPAGIERNGGVFNRGVVTQVAADLERHQDAALLLVDRDRRGRERDRQVGDRQRRRESIPERPRPHRGRADRRDRCRSSTPGARVVTLILRDLGFFAAVG